MISHGLFCERVCLSWVGIRYWWTQQSLLYLFESTHRKRSLNASQSEQRGRSITGGMAEPGLSYLIKPLLCLPGARLTTSGPIRRAAAGTRAPSSAPWPPPASGRHVMSGSSHCKPQAAQPITDTTSWLTSHLSGLNTSTSSHQKPVQPSLAVRQLGLIKVGPWKEGVEEKKSVLWLYDREKQSCYLLVHISFNLF